MRIICNIAELGVGRIVSQAGAVSTQDVNPWQSSEQCMRSKHSQTFTIRQELAQVCIGVYACSMKSSVQQCFLLLAHGAAAGTCWQLVT